MSYMTELDPRILVGCKNGDDKSWRTVFYGYYPLVKWVIVHTIYQVDDFTVNAIAQDTMVALAQIIDRIKDEHYLKCFLKRVARNKCIDYIRKHREVFEELSDDIPQSTDTSQCSDEVIDALHQAMAGLKEPCNTLVRKRYLEGASYKELAVDINVGIEQIGIRISRCLSFLRCTLKKMDISWEEVL